MKSFKGIERGDVIRHGSFKLTEGEVERIRELYKLGYTQSQLAEKFDVNQSNISLIVNRKIHNFKLKEANSA